MVTTIIQGIIDNIKFRAGEDDERTPTLYEGAYDTLNKATKEDNNAFIFLLRPYSWDSDIQSSRNVNETYSILLGFLKRTSFKDKDESDVDTLVINDLYTLYKAFIKELYKQGYKITSLKADDVFNDQSFDNNVSGLLATMSIYVEDNYNVCT